MLELYSLLWAISSSETSACKNSKYMTEVVDASWLEENRQLIAIAGYIFQTEIVDRKS